ncbi:MAG: molybdenum cofactor guanylyltransferase [Actinomycetota bacterium]|nr:molybdenum cofactor guanylyltransferase [Actinomycetota bacterium]
MITHTVGAVLAGGSASRMGTSKADLEYLGVRFVDHAIATLSLVFEEVVVCGGSYIGPLAYLKDPVGGAGPLDGILAALEHSNNRPVMVVPVDMPLISIELVTRLAEPVIDELAIRVASDGTSIQPLVGVYGSGLAPLITDRLSKGRRSVMDLVAAVDNVERINADTQTLTNINTPEDYEALTGGGAL